MASSVLAEKLADLQGSSIYQEISQCAADFQLLFNDEISHDIIVFCGPEKKPIYAHKVIVAARCPILYKQFSGSNDICIPNHDFEICYEFLSYLYSGNLRITDQNWELLLPLAEDFKLPKLKELCFSQMMKKVQVESVLGLILSARAGKNRYYDDIFVEKCVSLLAKKPKEVLDSPDLAKLDEQTIIFILQNSDLAIDELELFQYIIRWGKSQQKAGQPLSEVLKPHIMSLIRWPLIGMKDLFEVVKPHNVVPDECWVEALELLSCEEDLSKKYKPRGIGSGGIDVRNMFWSITNANHQLTNNKRTVKHLAGSSYDVAFSNVTITKTSGIVKWKVKIDSNIGTWIGVGVTAESKAKMKQHDWSHPHAHMSYVFSSNSYLWNMSVVSQNQKNSGIPFTTGNILELEVNTTKAEISCKNGKFTAVLTGLVFPVVPAAILYYADTVSLV